MTRPETTNDDSGRLALTPQQSAAADLLAAGASVADTAASISVARQTVSGSLHNDQVFQAALNRRREELWSRVTDRLRALLPKAIAVLDREMDQGTASVSADLHVIRAYALYAKVQPIGSSDPDEPTSRRGSGRPQNSSEAFAASELRGRHRRHRHLTHVISPSDCTRRIRLVSEFLREKNRPRARGEDLNLGSDGENRRNSSSIEQPADAITRRRLLSGARNGGEAHASLRGVASTRRVSVLHRVLDMNDDEMEIHTGAIDTRRITYSRYPRINPIAGLVLIGALRIPSVEAGEEDFGVLYFAAETQDLAGFPAPFAFVKAVEVPDDFQLFARSESPMRLRVRQLRTPRQQCNDSGNREPEHDCLLACMIGRP